MTDLAHYTSEAVTLLSSLISIPSISREEEKVAEYGNLDSRSFY